MKTNSKSPKLNYNKSVIRKEKSNGSYTTVSYSILRDKNLTSNSKILLIEILSDSDEFKISQTVYCNRLSWKPTQFRRAIANLIENGYIRKKKIGVKNLNHYTVSEYGNLKNEKVDDKKTESNAVNNEQPKQEEQQKEMSDDDFQNKLNMILNHYDEYLTDNNDLEKNIFEMVKNHKSIDDIVKAIQKHIYNSLIQYRVGRGDDKKTKQFNKFKDVLKDKIFNKGKIPERNASTIWADINKNKRLDLETLSADTADGI